MFEVMCIPGFDGRYLICNDATVYDKQERHEVKSWTNRVNGYKYVTLTTPDGDYTIKPVHRLVAEAFVPGRSPERCWVNHLDEDKSNNLPDNLQWCTPSENCRHHGAHLRAALHRCKGVLAYTIDNSKPAKAFKSIAAAGDYYGVDPTTITRAISDKYPNHHTAAGMNWRLA